MFVDEQNKIAKKITDFLNTNFDFNLSDIFNILVSCKITTQEFELYFPQKQPQLINQIIFNDFKKAMQIDRFDFDQQSFSKQVKILLVNFANELIKNKGTYLQIKKYLKTKKSLTAKLVYLVSDEIIANTKDASSDFSYYTKRFVLSCIILKCLPKILQSEDISDCEEFIYSAVDDVKKIHKAKQFIKDSKEKIKNLPILRYYFASKN